MWFLEELEHFNLKTMMNFHIFGTKNAENEEKWAFLAQFPSFVIFSHFSGNIHLCGLNVANFVKY